LLISFLSAIFAALSATPEPLDSARASQLGFDVQSGSSWASLSPDSGRSEAIILRDGTEIARIDSARWARKAIATSKWTLPRRPDLARLRDWTRPPDGLELDWTFKTSRSSHSSRLDRNLFTATLDVPWKDWVSAGAMGGIERTYSKYALDSISSDPQRMWWPWWGTRLCVRSACWEARTSTHPIPDALWTQDRMDSLILSRRNGERTRHWDSPPPRSDLNWQHSLTARVGIVGWRTTMDADRWIGASHELAIAPVAFGSIRWGLLAGRDNSCAWTGIVVGAAPRGFPLPKGATLVSTPLEFAFRYSDLNRMAFDIHTSFRLLPPWSAP